MREKKIEAKLTEAVRQRGGLAPKFTSPGFDGMPDRIVLMPGGHMAFVEVKAPGKKPRPLQAARHPFAFGTLKNGKTRSINPAPFVLETLKAHKEYQEEQKRIAGDLWNEGKFPNLVFTHADGSHLSQPTIWKAFQKALEDAGLDHHRLHDCRHTFAVNSIRAGDDIKTIQENMGHYSAAFTLDRYGHVTETMRQESANRMQAFIQGMSGNGGGNS